jgi:hypothetical protein
VELDVEREQQDEREEKLRDDAKNEILPHASSS